MQVLNICVNAPLPRLPVEPFWAAVAQTFSPCNHYHATCSRVALLLDLNISTGFPFPLNQNSGQADGKLNKKWDGMGETILSKTDFF